MDVAVVLQALVGGLAAGSVIGLVGLGFSLLAGTARVLQLAHGDLAVAAVLGPAVAVLGVAPVAGDVAPATAALLVSAVVLAGAGLSVVVVGLGVLPHLADPRSGRPTDVLGWVVALLAAGLVVREGLGAVLPRSDYALPDPLRLDRLPVLALPGGGAVHSRLLAVVALGLLLGAVVERTLVRSRRGLALRAVADDPDAAALCGVDARRALLVAAAVAGALAGVAGLLDAPLRAVGPDDGVLLGLAGAAAALLGGLGSLRGALVAGLGVGVAQAAAVTWLGARWAAVVPLALLVGLLVVRPERVRPGALR